MEISGEVCKAAGFYRCNIHHENIICMKPGNKFPECDHGSYGKHKTLWNPARNVKAIMAELKVESMI
jgi:hypothetical protein